MKNIRTWLKNIPLPDDPIYREQAPILQTLIVGLIIVGIVSLLLAIITIGIFSLAFVILFVWLLTYFVSLGLLRRRHFLASLNLLSFSLAFGLFFLFIPRGTKTEGNVYMLLLLPILLSGLIGTRRMMWTMVGLLVALFIAIGMLETTMPAVVGYMPYNPQFNFTGGLSFLIVACLPAMIIDRFSNKLRSSLRTLIDREQELVEVRNQQETVISERTAHLQRALAEVERREQALNHTLEALQRSQESVRKLSVPVLPVLPQVLAVPLIGDLDQERAETLMNNTLAAVIRERTRYIIFDITGVPVVDTRVARVLLQTADALRLMGTRVILVGIQPEVAQTIVSLGLDLDAFITQPDLRSAIASLSEYDSCRSPLREV